MPLIMRFSVVVFFLFLMFFFLFSSSSVVVSAFIYIIKMQVDMCLSVTLAIRFKLSFLNAQLSVTLFDTFHLFQQGRFQKP